MSLFTQASTLLTLRPRVKEEPPLLIISSGVLTSIFTLGLSLKQIEIDTRIKEIRIHHRMMWLIKRTLTLRFDALSHLEYTYKSIGTSWGWSFSGFGRQDEVEVFTLAVVDQDGREYPLCSYRGEGSVHTGWSGVLLGDDSTMDFTGTQEGESRQLLRMVKEITQLPIGKPFMEDLPKKACPNCGREVAEYAVKCIYCATKLNP